MSAQEVSGPNKASTSLLREGELIGGRYRIERCLGGGGMASVYRAMHVGLDQPVALKVVSPVIREVPGIVSRFMREARAATRLKGEHVVRVFDVGTTDAGGGPKVHCRSRRPPGSRDVPRPEGGPSLGPVSRHDGDPMEAGRLTNRCGSASAQQKSISPDPPPT